MPSLDDTFKAVGVVSARDKILALCNAPALFFNVELQGSEDRLMVHTVSYIVATLLARNHAPDLEQHIVQGIFEGSVAKRRNLAYGMCDPAFVDAYIESISTVAAKMKAIRKECDDRIAAMILEETGVPFFKFQKEYKDYHAGQAALNS
jgi:predicted glycoside hydrolase/deacetylase ChbG (UPF0249 family)